MLTKGTGRSPQDNKKGIIAMGALGIPRNFQRLLRDSGGIRLAARKVGRRQTVLHVTKPDTPISADVKRILVETAKPEPVFAKDADIAIVHAKTEPAMCDTKGALIVKAELKKDDTFVQAPPYRSKVNVKLITKLDALIIDNTLDDTIPRKKVTLFNPGMFCPSTMFAVTGATC